MAVHKESITLTLRQDDEVVGERKLESAYALAEDLLPSVDALLEEKGLKPEDIEDFTVESTLPEGYSARRIAETTASMFLSGVRKK